MGQTTWQKPETVWGLVPNLEVLKETDFAILFVYKGEEDLWIPKSQINFTYWTASQYFVPISKWLLGKKGLSWFACVPNSQISARWVNLQDSLYEVWLEKQKGQDRQLPPAQTGLFPVPLATADIAARPPNPFADREGKDTRNEKFIAGQIMDYQEEIQRRSLVRDFQNLSPNLLKLETLRKIFPKEEARTRQEVPTPKRARAMNLHRDEEKE